METLIQAGGTTFILFVIVSLGYFARKVDWMDDKSDASLSKIITNITCPAMIFSSVLSNDNLPQADFILNILIISFVAYIPILLLAWFAPKLYSGSKSAEGSHQFTIAFGNTGFIGFAVVGAIMGKTAVLYASMYNIIFNLMIFSFGAFFVARSSTTPTTARERLKRTLHSLRGPAMISCIITLFLALAGITDDGVIGQGVELLGAMTPPASMLVIGSTLAKYDVKRMFGDWRVYPTAFLRLLGVPAVVFLVASLMTTDPQLIAALTLENAMPAAAMGSILCIMYNGDLETMSKGMFLTTVFSVITIPIVALLVL